MKILTLASLISLPISPQYFVGRIQRCAKLTISGVVSPCEEDSKQLALDTLFATHPQMANWPEDHGFIPCEMKINDENGLWMIANYGGGGYMNAADYYDSEPVHHPAHGFGDRSRSLEDSTTSAACYNMATHECECHSDKCGNDLCAAAGGVWSDRCPGTCECDPASASTNETTEETAPSEAKGANTDSSGHEHSDGMGDGHGHGNGGGGGHGHHGDGSGGGKLQPQLPRPNFGKDAAGHARWIVAKSLWTTITTLSSKSEGEPFGNIRSVVDGACFLSSNGLPYFYVPSPDPTAIDIKKNSSITLTFTEAALAERVGEDGSPCGGMDAEDPTCAKLTLIGHAKPLEDHAEIKLAENAFKIQHPRASWLSEGGAHTGGLYYTLHLHEIMFLRNYGGFAQVSSDEYISWNPDPSKLPGEEQCGTVEGEYLNQTDYPTFMSSSFSFYAISLVFAAFIGYIFVVLSAGKVKTLLRNNRKVYAKANYEEIIELEVSKGEVC